MRNCKDEIEKLEKDISNLTLARACKEEQLKNIRKEQDTKKKNSKSRPQNPTQTVDKIGTPIFKGD